MIDPWTSPDPQPGDFDDELATMKPGAVEVHEGDPSATLRLVVSVEGEDATRLERLASARGIKPADVLAELLRAADPSAA